MEQKKTKTGKRFPVKSGSRSGSARNVDDSFHSFQIFDSTTASSTFDSPNQVNNNEENENEIYEPSPQKPTELWKIPKRKIYSRIKHLQIADIPFFRTTNIPLMDELSTHSGSYVFVDTEYIQTSYGNWKLFFKIIINDTSYNMQGQFSDSETLIYITNMFSQTTFFLFEKNIYETIPNH